ncbi:MAG: type II toxin-antitoxin system YafQ family toxin [Candidatus Symbiobacter sp.]|nr:type II toxin-antitoxin system YafQ family toxin [Candidatus Symbiobacter sp.]
MRRVEKHKNFINDLKRAYHGKYRDGLDDVLAEIIFSLAQDLPLAAKYRDHPLRGKWQGHRECHLRPDLLLIYRKPDENVLELIRLGSHSELKLG